MANDTTRMEAEAEKRRTYNPKGANPPTDDQATITSLQRELAEARAACRQAVDAMRDYPAYPEDADADKLSAAQRRCERVLAPAPSDVKGEEPVRIEVSPDELAALREAKERMDSRALLTPLTDPSVRGVLVDDGELTNQLKGGALYINGDLLFRADEDGVDNSNWQPVKLVPASEFGVAARGEPGLKPLPEGAWILFPSGESGEFAIVDSGFPVSPHLGWFNKLDPSLYAMPDGERASVWSVDSITAQLTSTKERVKELEAEVERLEQCIEVYERSCTQWAEQCNGLIAERDAAQADAERLLNAIAEALAFPEIKDRTIENAVSNLLQRFDLFKATHNAHLKDKDERIKELEAERERLTKDNARWEEACGLASESAGACRVDAERLRKAIETHRRNTEHGWHASDFTDEDRELWSALSPSPAAKENDMESAWLLETTIGNSPVWYTIHHKCGRVFTTDAYHAEHFKSKEAAEAFAAALKLDGWKATEHGFD